MTDYLKNGQTVTGVCYSVLMINLPSVLFTKRRGKLSHEVLAKHVLGTAPAHRAQQAVQPVEQCGFEILPSPPQTSIPSSKKILLQDHRLDVSEDAIQKHRPHILNLFIILFVFCLFFLLLLLIITLKRVNTN